MNKMSSSNKIYQLLIILRVITICFLCLENAYSVDGLTAEQIREVEKLRSELNDAFEKDEEQNLEQRGVIVQPIWTQSGKSENKVDAKVVVTTQGLQETKRLRDEISKAVRDDVYVASIAHSTGGDTHRVQELHQALSLQGRSRDVLDTMLSSTQNLRKSGHEEAEKVGSVFDDLDDTNEGPNVVEANAAQEYDIDIGKLQRLEISKRRTKEMLVLKSIEEDYSFNLGEDVLAWAFIQHDGEDYFIGQREQDLLIVRQEDLKYEKGHVLEIGYPITYLETYSYWNLAQQKQEGVIIIATGDKVFWYRGNNETHQIELYWEWSTGRAISGLTHFKIDGNDYLAVSSNESSRSGYYALNIYQFDLHAQEFWIAQRLQLQFSCQEVTLLDTGRDIVLAVAQNGTAAIYTFNPRATLTDQIRFQLSTNIASEGIEYITAFKMGGRSYLGLGGMQPQILLYQQGHFTPKTIFGQNFGLVELFFPIPVRTYRDDLILLIQHRVDFGTHKLTDLEALIWNGESFETSIPVPCQLGTHMFYGVNCMLDIQRDAGLKGAALLKRGDEFSVIVPRHKAESGLFRFHTELLARNSEVKDLQEIYAFLQDWVKEQDELITQAQAFLEQPQAEEAQQLPDLSDLDLLKTTELEFTGNIGEIYVNDYRWTEEDTDVDLDLLIQSIEELGHELLNERAKRDLTGAGQNLNALSFDEVEVDELLVDLVNNEKFYIQDGTLSFDGVLNMRSLEVQEHLEEGEEQAQVENLEIDGNLEFEEINGIPWQTLKQGFVFRNNPISLEELEIQGEVIVEDHLSVNTLNALKFPEDYLWSSGPTTSVVKAEKTFLGNLTANAVDTGGLINGINPFDAITLSDSQDWIGTTTFTKLKVTEKFDLNGTARGRGLDEFESNPTLLESNIVTAACNFAQLEVEGPVFLNEKFENLHISELLGDIVQRPNSPVEEIDIPSKKTFTAVTFPLDLRISDNKVNDIPVDQFVTMHTSQELDISELKGYVYFNNLTINGTYDGVKIEELLQNAIKVNETTNASETQLNMIHPITVDKFDVRISLNDVPIAEGFQTRFENLITNELSANDLVAKIADIRGDIQGNGKFNGLNLSEFLERRMWTEPIETGNIFLDELILENELNTDALHGINSEFLFNFLEKIDEIPEMILDGKIQVDHVIVTGDVQVHKLNGQNFDEDIQLTAIWLNRPNYLSTNLQFLEPLIVHADLYCEGTLNGNDLPDLIDDMVFRNENKTLQIHAPKNFIKNVVVAKNLKLDAINGLPFERIATNRHIVHFNGTLHINGNLYVGEIELDGHLNDFPIENLTSLVRYDRYLNAYVLLGKISLPKSMELRDLSVQGSLNNFTAVGQFFQNLVHKNQICKLTGSNTFTGRVLIDRGAYIRNLNGYNLLTLLNNIVYTRELQPISIKSAVEFRAPVRATDITVKMLINTTNINGCSLQEWLNDTLRVDRNENVTELLKFGSGALDGNSFYAGFWNDVNLSQIITLHTPQNLSNELFFSELHLDGTLDVQGLINEIDLKAEYENTLMKNRGDQHVSTALTMPSSRVLNSLKIMVPVNGGKDLKQLALLNEPLELRSPLFFQNVTAKTLHTRDHVSGINLDYWRKNALWLNERPQQWITGNWGARALNVMTDFDNDMSPSPTGEQLMRSTREEDNFYEVYQKVDKILKKREQRVNFVKYLEENRTLELELHAEAKIRQTFALTLNSSRYLLLNAGCNTYMYGWDSSKQQSSNITNFETGYIDQVIAIPNVDESLTLRVLINAAAVNEYNCTSAGLNTWAITGNATTLVDNAESKVFAIYQTPKSPLSYYALVKEGSAVLVHEISIFDGTVKNSWNLPTEIEDNKCSHRFLPALEDNPRGINLSNGRHIVQLQEPNSTFMGRATRSLMHRFALPLFKHGVTKKLQSPTESILKPNITTSTTARKLTFADFKQVVERIIDDVIYRLNLEVNITQLSIPESDLYDEHLVQDFIAIMQELQQQKIFSPNIFAEVDLATLEIPANPAQVLAARTVHIVWPVIVEIDEIHSYLKENGTKTHPICGNITNSLGALVKDVLALAYDNASNKTKDYTKSMSAVIKRIRKFQQTLEKLANELNSHDKNKSVQKALNANETSTVKEEKSKLSASATVLSSVFMSHPYVNSTISIAPGTHIPCRDSGEVISFQVGPSSKPHLLTAITWASKPHLVVAGRTEGIKLYTDYVKAEVFQTITATKPRSLAALRIGDETFLAFVENCCVVRVFTYRGVQGFVEFVKFKLSERVEKVIGLNLPKDALNERYFFTASTARSVKFYEAIMAGNKKNP